MPKTVIEQKKRNFNNKLNGIFPVSTSLKNLLKSNKKATQLIINIEKKDIKTEDN